MKTLISQFFINYSKPQFSPPPFLFRFPNQNQTLLHISRPNRLSSVRAHLSSESSSYGGWDDLRPVAGDSDQLRKFLASTGIDDRKHVFAFLLGLICAFAISRVRVSSIVVVPASVLIFSLGFSVGFVRRGGFGELNGTKRRTKEDGLVVYSEKLRSLVEVFDGFRVRVDDLKCEIQRAIDSRGITVSDLESYVEAIEGVSLAASDGRSIVEECVDNLARSSVGFAENYKTSKRKKEPVEIGYAVWQYIGDLFKEKLADHKPSKAKINGKRESVEKVGGDHSRANGLSSNNDKEMVSDSVDDSVGIANFGHSQDSVNRSALNETGNGRIKLASSNKNMRSEEVSWGIDSVTESKENSHQNNRLQFMSNGHISSKMGHDRNEMWESNDNLLDSVDFSVRMKHMENKASFVQEQILKESDGDYRSSLIGENSEDETYGPQIKQERVNHEENFPLDDQLSGNESELPSLSSSSISEDVLFDRYVTEANDLLKQAKEFIKATHNEERAEIVLYRSAKLLSKAITMKPMSLLAVGQLGNTYLLHGEMKLRISRELRRHLTRSDPSSVEKWIRMQDKITSKDDIASVLINTCEECEELLVEAGRKYRLALSIDGNDVRALYNWGLALTFRAQLIADIGPGAAFDADELFLAAIDKFDAMMSKGNVHAPDALFRWGMALQQRSRLRPSNGKEKVKLLQQAKRLYEDALNMDSNNVQVRRALSSCMSELSSRHLYF
ncbi:PREDICTED: uncharacterized protein LOC101314920 [Fragaria vesca subsp. vesca]|uniref:uncharacterized protein LOC101314920 n=1 Tax=Fragaria vesca subsp. vesca TaxID=101020 RepID=UPI0002C35509|nr:PREDICTED: uncharacterized protein LOC101314920 [Fragaria vesca subsp. vesca]